MDARGRASAHVDLVVARAVVADCADTEGAQGRGEGGVDGAGDGDAGEGAVDYERAREEAVVAGAFV